VNFALNILPRRFSERYVIVDVLVIDVLLGLIESDCPSVLSVVLLHSDLRFRVMTLVSV
jgi:hypothetical protein